MALTGAQRPDWGRHDEPRGDRFVVTLVAGLIVGVIVVIVSISLATLIFSGELSPHLARGIGLTLVAGALTTGLIALTSSYPGMIAYPQERVAPILALAATAIVASLTGQVESETLFLTVVAALAATTLVNGAFLAALGLFRLGGFIRFIPYPVIGGFLAGTGWLLVRGSLGVMTSLHVDAESAHELMQAPALLQWMTGVGFGMCLVLATRRSHHHLVMPGLLLGGVGLFYVVVLLLGLPLESLRAEGWLLGPFPHRQSWSFLTLQAFQAAHWAPITAQLGNLATILLISIVSVLLNSGALELVVKRDVDLNRELRAAGITNLVVGAAGGTVGFHSLSISRLAHRLGSESRLVGLIAAVCCLAVLLVGTTPLAALPRAVLGGLLFFLGMHFLVEWLYDAWFRLSRADYAVVVLILLGVAAFGYLHGVAVGLVACIVLFLVNYSRVDVVKHAAHGRDHRSNVDRPSSHVRLLQEHGGKLSILKLQGYIFFGTANTLLERVRSLAARSDARYVALDFKHVSGIDSSSTLSFVKMLQSAEREGFVLLFAGVAPEIQRLLDREGFADAPAESYRAFADLDHAVEWCEDSILADEQIAADQYDNIPLADQLRDELPNTVDVDRLLGYFERLEIPAGATLVRQGEPADDLYLIDRGRVTAQLELEGTGAAGSGVVRLRTMHSGTVVGEVGLILGEKRSASVVADEPSTVYRLSAESFQAMRDNEPAVALAFHGYLTRLMAERLANTAAALQSFLE